MSANRERSLTKPRAAVDIVLAILLIPCSAVLAAVIVDVATAEGPAAGDNLLLVLLIQALLALAGLLALLTWRSQRWGQIGLQPLRGQDFSRALIVLLTAFGANAVLTIAVYLVSPQILHAHQEALRPIALNLRNAPLAAVLALLLLVGFYEELVARGLLLTRLRSLIGGYWAPVLLSAALFGLGHFYQGAYGTVQTALLGAVFAAFTVRWGTLWPAIFAHAAVNMLSLLQFDAQDAVSALGAAL